MISQLKDVRTASKAFSTAQSSAMQVPYNSKAKAKAYNSKAKIFSTQRRTLSSGASKMRTGLSRMLSHRSVGDEKCFPISIQICTKVGELFSVWTEVQRDFSAHIKEFQHQFDMILEGAKQLDLAKVFLLAYFLEV